MNELNNKAIDSFRFLKLMYKIQLVLKLGLSLRPMLSIHKC